MHHLFQLKHILVKQLASCLHKGSRQAFYHPCIILFFVWMNELWPHNFHLFSYPQFNAHFLKTLDNEVIKHLLHSQTFGMHILFRSCGTNTHSYTHAYIWTHVRIEWLTYQYEKLLFTHSCNAFMHFCLSYPIG